MSYKLLTGDALEQLRTLPDESAHVCVTSPPYYGLRTYHEDDQIGLEPTPDAYVAKLLGVFREVKRVLRNDGTLWVVIGDSYAGSWGARGRGAHTVAPRPDLEAKQGTDCPARYGFPGIKPKDLIGIPWVVAFALRADGWYLRSDIVWEKPNAMPSSVRDRPTPAHEYIFLFSKSRRYYYDNEAVAEPAVSSISGAAARFRRGNSKRAQAIPGQSNGTHRPDREDVAYNGPTRNRRSVWSIPTKPHVGAHFATFPPELVMTPIRAGSSAYGCCAACGAPYERVVGEAEAAHGRSSGNSRRLTAGDAENGRLNTHVGSSTPWSPTSRPTVGWRPTCDCAAEVVPCAVLDPFVGSGTTGAVALAEGRVFVGIDLNPVYVAMAQERLATVRPARYDQDAAQLQPGLF